MHVQHSRGSDNMVGVCWQARNCFWDQAGVLPRLTPRSSPVPGHSPGLASSGSVGLQFWTTGICTPCSVFFGLKLSSADN